ncbi:cobyric acid synthase [Megasphaera sueciensis]|jgi:adenosylcobyric acid synthase|uniref:cobyric acid synthase n=1 Tax=Megasphaera sueciensis TaxID=349094 RepID=UPI003D00DED4|nr:cobyric acid synthase [Megasphaera sp.]
MTKPIMVVGTMRNTGKSWIVTGLCRIFHQDGKSVAPFKAQNTASSSFITDTGEEISRAQAVQAEAADIEPTSLMNPVLLKPVGEKTFQVIVQGHPVGSMTADTFQIYHDKKLGAVLRESYEALAAVYDIVILEGAGNPSKVDSSEDDLANMGMAKVAQAPGILVADMDRGGVFATLFGTIMLMRPEERVMIKGIIINKFSGEPDSLTSGLRMIEEKTGIPVLGVVPMANIDIEDNLSASIKSDDVEKIITIDVIALPHISNFTDFNAFECIPGVALRYIHKGSELTDPDMIIIPGTLNTIGDLKWMRQNGIEEAILTKAREGVVVFGVCGGYQMMGEKLADPYHVEEGGVLKGMGLLKTDTMFSDRKRTFRVEGFFGNVRGIFRQLKGKRFYGYEIHSGITDFPTEDCLTHMRPTYEPGEIVPEGSQYVDDVMNVYGTFIHGIFDCEGVASTMARALFSKKGRKPADMQSVNYRSYKQEQYDKLADCLRRHIDMEKIYKIVEEGL